MAGTEFQEFNLIVDKSEGVDRLITSAWRDDLLVLDNHATYALAGNANNPDVQKRVAEVKTGSSGARLARQPLGWTRFFEEHVLEAIDVNRLESPQLQNLARNPDELTARVGALTFVRAAANMIAKKEYEIPDTIIPPEPVGDAPFACVQLYSPEGIASTSRLTRQALAEGVEPVMSSVNHTNEPEAVNSAMARSFMERTPGGVAGPQVIAHYYPEDTSAASRNPHGSYPIIEFEEDTLIITRDGCFSTDILQAVLDGYPITVAPDIKRSNYPDGQLRLEDLPVDLQKERGASLRLGILAYIGWSNDT